MTLPTALVWMLFLFPWLAAVGVAAWTWVLARRRTAHNDALAESALEARDKAVKVASDTALFAQEMGRKFAGGFERQAAVNERLIGALTHSSQSAALERIASQSLSNQALYEKDYAPPESNPGPPIVARDEDGALWTQGPNGQPVPYAGPVPAAEPDLVPPDQIGAAPEPTDEEIRRDAV